MNINVKRILREKIILINLCQKNIILKILKSINQNNNIKNNIKIYGGYLMTKNVSKNTSLSKKHKICLKTGKRSGVLNGFSFSRYKIKNLILTNQCTNIKKHNF